MKKLYLGIVTIVAIALLLGCPQPPPPATSSIPEEFSEMEGINYSGQNPGTIEDIAASSSYSGKGVLYGMLDSLSNSTDPDVLDLTELISAIEEGQNFTPNTTINFDTMSMTGNIIMALNEQYENKDTKIELEMLLEWILDHQNLVEIQIITDDNGTPADPTDDVDRYDIQPAVVTDADGNPLYLIDNGSFNTSFKADKLSFSIENGEMIEVMDVDEFGNDTPSGKHIILKYFKVLADADIFFQVGGLQVGTIEETGEFDADDDPITQLLINSGLVSWGIDVNFKLAAVISSTHPDYKGGKVILDMNYKIDLSDYDLSSIDVQDLEQVANALSDIFNGLDYPAVDYMVLNNDNELLFEGTLDLEDYTN
jgi:hypothetical protein